MPIKISDYNIYVPVSRTNEAIFVHGYTGAIDVVSTEIAEYLQNQTNEIEGLSEVIKEQLLKRGYLTTMESQEEKSFAINIANIIVKNMRSKYSPCFSMVLQYGCNLKCIYCYENKLRGKEEKWLKKTLTHEKVDEIFKAALKINNNTLPSITLFGGEPLQLQHREIVQYILSKGEQTDTIFTAITNGLELESYIDHFGNEPGKINQAQITLDGPPEIHDRRRIKPDGSSSFYQIVNNIDKVVKTNISLILRVNIDKQNINSLPELLNFVLKKEWFNYKNFSISLAPVIALNCSSMYGSEILKILKDNDIYNMYKEKIDIDGGLRKMLSKCLTKGTVIQYKQNICNNWESGYIFDPHGDVYSCLETVGEPKYKIGEYTPHLKLYGELYNLRASCAAINVSKCRDCKYLLICGGSCPLKINENNIPQAPFCKGFEDYFKTLVEYVYRGYNMASKL